MWVLYVENKWLAFQARKNSCFSLIGIRKQPRSICYPVQVHEHPTVSELKSSAILALQGRMHERRWAGQRPAPRSMSAPCLNSNSLLVERKPQGQSTHPKLLKGALTPKGVIKAIQTISLRSLMARAIILPPSVPGAMEEQAVWCRDYKGGSFLPQSQKHRHVKDTRLYATLGIALTTRCLRTNAPRFCCHASNRPDCTTGQLAKVCSVSGTQQTLSQYPQNGN